MAQDQPTDLTQAFNSMSLNDGIDANRYMDTGATSHLTSDTGSLSSVTNNCNINSVFVGNRQSIPVTHSGQSKLHTPHRPLHLHNILVTPNIIKNLIFVCRFTSDNIVSIEFDPFGFSVKDLATHQVLLRCDSYGDLYLVPSSLKSYVALFVDSSSLWHQRLGHPGASVFNKLVSSHFISCNKTSSHINCLACQLGKHIRLPFVKSNSNVSTCFDIIHYDLWESPIPSTSGIKYYIIFLDHFSHFLWVYCLRYKYDVFGKFLHFHNFF